MRIGIVGYTNINTGLGIQAREYIDNFGITDILSVETRKGRERWSCKQVDVSFPPEDNKVLSWLENSNIDLLLTIETPFSNNLYNMARELGIKSVIQINHELFDPNDSKWNCCDLFLCPNKSAFEKASRFGDKRIFCKIPIDVNNFPYRKRTGKTFIHIAGYFGFMGRKSVSETIQAFSESTAEKLMVYIQNPIDKLPRESQLIIASDDRIEVRTECDNPSDIYKEGDIAIQPSKFEGYGRTLVEPLSCGIPVITLDADPMNTYFNEKSLLIPIKSAEIIRCGNFRIKKNNFLIEDLIDRIDWCVENDTSKFSIRARRYVEKNYSWEAQKDNLYGYFCGII